MNENRGAQQNESPEDKDGLTPEQREAADYWLSQYAKKEIPKKERRESTQEVTELQGLLAAFEAEHSLAELHAIVDLTPQDAPKYPVRESAKKALIPIVDLINTLGKETDITAEKFAELDAHYRRLSKAVGMINNGKVRHD